VGKWALWLLGIGVLREEILRRALRLRREGSPSVATALSSRRSLRSVLVHVLAFAPQSRRVVVTTGRLLHRTPLVGYAQLVLARISGAAAIILSTISRLFFVRGQEISAVLQWDDLCLSLASNVSLLFRVASCNRVLSALVATFADVSVLAIVGNVTLVFMLQHNVGAWNEIILKHTSLTSPCRKQKPFALNFAPSYAGFSSFFQSVPLLV